MVKSAIIAMSISVSTVAGSELVASVRPTAAIDQGCANGVAELFRWRDPGNLEPPLVAHIRACVASLFRDLDEGDEQPTDAAVKACIDLLGETATWRFSRQAMPFPVASTMGDGDLLLEWADGDKRLLLFILPSGSSRLQQVTGRGHAARAEEVARGVKSVDLANSLRWLAQ